MTMVDPQMPPQAQGAPGGGAPSDDAQKKAMFEQLAGPLLDYIWGDGLEDIKGSLQAGQEQPDQAIGKIAGSMMGMNAMQAMDNGVKIPPDVMTATAMQVINNITDVAVNMGIVPEDQANEVGESAFIISIAEFGKVAAQQSLTPEEKQQYANIVAEMQKIAQMKEGGSPPNEQPQETPAGPPQSMGAAIGG